MGLKGSRLRPSLSTLTAESSFRSFVKRHRRGLTLLGTGIVFFTFIFRDVLRENARGKKDNYDTAVTYFLILDGLIEISDRMRHFEEVAESDFRALIEMASKESQPRYYEDTPTLKLAIDYRLEELRNAIRNLRAVPSIAIAPQEKTLDEVDKETEKLAAEFNNLNGRTSDSQTETLRKQYSGLRDEARDLQHKLQQISGPVLDTLKKESSEAAGKYQTFDRLSLGFYILGVIVTVIGQLAENKDGSSSA